MDFWGEPVRAGELLDDTWELKRLIGKGGMAEVWSAADVRRGGEAAVKFLRPDIEDLRCLDPQELEEETVALRGRFRREARFLAELRHPGIPEFYGQGSHRGLPYLVMQLIDGLSLHAFLARCAPLPLSSAAAVAVQVADALVCAHIRPLVHRDLKPHNIMLSAEGVAVLIDFGIAKPLGAHVTNYTRQGSTLGSRGYQAPEQILEKEPMTRTDIYAFGCICYELFTGSRPFVAADHHTLNDMHLKSEPLAPSLHGAGVPSELDELILRMLAKSPQERPDAVEALETFRSMAPRSGDPAPSPRLVPDPTAPFRSPRTSPTGPGRPAPDAEEWLDPSEVADLCDAASLEIEENAPADAVGRLAELAPRVRAEWGVRRPVVVRVWRIAAEGLRLAGECGGAARLYDGLAGELGPGDGENAVAARAVARLRAAECRLAFGEIDAALRVIADCLSLAGELPAQLAERITDVCSEVTVDVEERCADPDAGD
ncbi:protein kinase [Streptomyces sp. NPDC048512]|uniref:serine/threonine-protein kinase n=1 Tax=Streptomyces sp. NPDC048512 TaxID=3365563 RepID=UPI0037210C21